MLNMEKVLQPLQNIPNGYQNPFSNFFKKSNELFIIKYKKLGTICNIDDDHFGGKTQNINETSCNDLRRQQIFDKMNPFQSQYYSMHQFICRECNKSLPTEHLLDLHILEQHDSLFAERIARGDCIYSCLLAGCDKKFYKTHKRMQHCITDHKFPSNFRFQEARNHQAVQKLKSESQYSNNKSNCKDYEHYNSLKAAKLKNISFGYTKMKAFSFNIKKQETKKDGETTTHGD